MTERKQSEMMYDAITDISPELIEQAEKQVLKPSGYFFKRYWKGIIAAVLALVVAGAAILLPKSNSPSSVAFAIATAEYPEEAKFPDETNYLDDDGNYDYETYNEDIEVWHSQQYSKRTRLTDKEWLYPYFEKTMVQFLSGTNEESNTVFSPLNIYMALSMLAEVSEGTSREQILTLLGEDNIETLREQSREIWETTYRDDGAVTSIMANSIWLNQDVTYKEELLNSLAQNYYASSFQGEMGSLKYDRALQDWLNQETDGLLKEQAKQIKMDPSNVMAIVSTILFQAKWQAEYRKENTKQGIFHTPTEDVSVDYMNASNMGTYYWHDNFSAIRKGLDTEGNHMWFFLPDEGFTCEDLIEEGEFLNLLFSPTEWENKKSVLVNESIPKFDITSQLELSDGLKELGITDVFKSEQADFTPMTEDVSDIFLSKVNHDTRVAIDEEGVTAAAYTVMLLCGSGIPEDEVDFVLNRPFLFVITSGNGLPMFAGIVNQPAS